MRNRSRGARTPGRTGKSRHGSRPESRPGSGRCGPRRPGGQPGCHGTTNARTEFRQGTRADHRHRHARREPLGTRDRGARRRRLERGTGERLRRRTEPGPVHRAAVVQLPATGPRRRHGHDPARDAARPVAGPDARAAQLEAAARGLAGQRERHDRPRCLGGRPEHDPERGRAVHRSAARRRLGAVRLGRHRGRHQRAPAREHRRRRRHALVRLARIELRNAHRPVADGRHVVRAVADQARRLRRGDADRVRLERPRARRQRLPHARRRVQGTGSHRARRSRTSASWS